MTSATVNTSEDRNNYPQGTKGAESKERSVKAVVASVLAQSTMTCPMACIHVPHGTGGR